MNSKGTEELTWLDRMMNALEYLESSLDGEVDINAASRIACSSTFHFQRMFHLLTGVTVSDYVRKRRLSLAAQELASSSIKVIDVAMKYDYDTPEAFCKAFRKAHGITPSAARLPGTKLKLFPRLSFHISLKGDKDMDYRIVEKEAFSVVGKALTMPYTNDENLILIPEFWQKSTRNGTLSQLESMMSGKGELGSAILGVCIEFKSDPQEFTYVIGVQGGPEQVPQGLVRKEIPAATWAAFECVGALPDAIQALWARVFSEFFPATGFNHAEGGADVEVYPSGNVQDENYKCEVWIPVVKKT